MRLKTPPKEFIFLAAIFLVGYLDWLTTVTGVLYRGGVELNPLLAGMTTSSMLTFSTFKLTAVAIAAFAAYKAADITKHAKSKWRLTSKFLNGGISLTVLAIAVVVANNMIVVFKI